MPFIDQRLRFLIAAFRRVAQRFRRVAVHQDLPREHQRVAPLRFREEGFGRLRMHRAKGDSGRRAVAQELVEEETRIAGAMGRICKLLFLDEGVFSQPFEKLRAEAPDHLGLREMDVRIDEARQDEVGAMILDRRAVRQRGDERPRFTRLSHEAVFDDQRAVFDIVPGPLARLARIGGEPEQTAAQDLGRASSFPCAHAAARSRFNLAMAASCFSS